MGAGRGEVWRQGMKAWRGGVPGCYAICVVVMAANRSQEKNRLRKKRLGVPVGGYKDGGGVHGQVSTVAVHQTHGMGQGSEEPVSMPYLQSKNRL